MNSQQALINKNFFIFVSFLGLRVFILTQVSFSLAQHNFTTFESTDLKFQWVVDLSHRTTLVTSKSTLWTFNSAHIVMTMCCLLDLFVNNNILVKTKVHYEHECMRGKTKLGPEDAAAIGTIQTPFRAHISKRHTLAGVNWKWVGSIRLGSFASRSQTGNNKGAP